MPPAPPKTTSAQVSLSVTAIYASCMAASAIMPTVAEFNPESSPYTGRGKVSPTRETPMDSPNMPIAPRRLFLVIRLSSDRKHAKGLEPP